MKIISLSSKNLIFICSIFDDVHIYYNVHIYIYIYNTKKIAKTNYLLFAKSITKYCYYKIK